MLLRMENRLTEEDSKGKELKERRLNLLGQIICQSQVQRVMIGGSRSGDDKPAVRTSY